jgi:hypothetical protein
MQVGDNLPSIVKLTFTFLILAIILSDCGNTSTKSLEASQLLKYSILSEDIYDIPLKTQIKINVIIEDSLINKENIKSCLTQLYDETIIRTGFKYHNNPTNIYIYAFTSIDKAKSGMGQWVAMISKGYNDKLPSINISEIQLNAIDEKEVNKWNFTYIQRQEIWSKIIYLEDRSRLEADEKYPLDKPGITINEIKQNSELMKVLKDKYIRKLAKEFNVDKAIIDSIGFEGIVNGWAFPKID